MKLNILIATILITACGLGMRTGEGSYTGRLIDVSWEGLFWKSCEIRQQTSVLIQGGHEERASGADEATCKELQKHMGEVITIHYSTRTFSGCSIETRYLIESFEMPKEPK